MGAQPAHMHGSDLMKDEEIEISRIVFVCAFGSSPLKYWANFVYYCGKCLVFLSLSLSVAFWGGREGGVGPGCRLFTTGKWSYGRSFFSRREGRGFFDAIRICLLNLFPACDQ